MEITINISQVMAIISLAGAIGGILAFMYNLVSRFQRLEKHSREDHETQKVILEALFAVLDGQKQQGCNGAVTEAHSKLREHMIERG